jgi:hypothetical protein
MYTEIRKETLAVCLITPPYKRLKRKAMQAKDGKCDMANRRRDRRYRSFLFYYRQITFPINNALNGSHVIYQG